MGSVLPTDRYTVSMEDIHCLYLTDLGPGIRVGLLKLGRGGILVTEIG